MVSISFEGFDGRNVLESDFRPDSSEIGLPIGILVRVLVLSFEKSCCGHIGVESCHSSSSKSESDISSIVDSIVHFLDVFHIEGVLIGVCIGG